MSDDFQNEIRFLGIESSPAFVREPEGNGCIERFFKTLKEQLLWVRHFRSIPELVHALQEFRALYNSRISEHASRGCRSALYNSRISEHASRGCGRSTSGKSESASSTSSEMAGTTK